MLVLLLYTLLPLEILEICLFPKILSNGIESGGLSHGALILAMSNSYFDTKVPKISVIINEKVIAPYSAIEKISTI
jgi:hypothetical protein